MDAGLRYEWVVAVCVVIERADGRILALRRSPSKDAGPGLWEVVSGRVEPGEQPHEAAAREVLEETGLKVELDPQVHEAYVTKRLENPMVIMLYRARYVSGTLIRSDEHDADDWLTPAEFRARTTLTRLADAVERIPNTR